MSPLADAFGALLRRDPTAALAWTKAGVRDRSALAALADRIEGLLAGDPPGSRVALSLRDGFSLLAGVLAAARRSDAVVLLDAADPRAPRLDLARRFGAVALLHDDPVLTRVACGGGLPAGDLRAIKLTSGSTDEPRGIGVGDAQLWADAAALEAAMGIGDGDRVLAAVPMSFSYGVGNLLVPALARGRFVVLPDASSPSGFLAALRHGGPTVLPAVPALLRALLPLGSLPPSLRLVLSAGAALPAELAAAFRQRFGLPVHAFYGSTESGGICFDRTGDAAERGSVGTPVDGVDVAVGDDGRVVVRSPAVGLALDGGDNPSGGRFVAPDLGSFEGGELVLRGRAGAVFDVGGHKVDPAEVERIVREVAGVEDVAVMPWRDEHGRACCAAVVAGRGIDEVELRRHCARRLPAAKVPRQLVLVDALPRTERGKLQRSELERLLARGEPSGEAAT